METRQLGDSDLHLTPIGFGTWAAGGGDWAFGWGPQDDDQSVGAILRALELGVNWIDTAAVYGLGHAEEVVARALKEWGGEVILATKCGLPWRKRRVQSSLRAESILKEVEGSLRRLGVETIDLYQVHWPRPDAGVEEAWETLARLKEQGKVRHVGVSNFDVGQMERCSGIAPITSLQPPYSMVERAVEAEVLPYCLEHGVGVVAYSPMQAGLLTGRFSARRLADLPRGDWRRGAAAFQEPVFSATLELVRRLQPLAEASGHTVAQLALAWVLHQPAVTSAIVGGRSPAQVEETTAAGLWRLSPEELGRVDEILKEAAVPNPAPLG